MIRRFNKIEHLRTLKNSVCGRIGRESSSTPAGLDHQSIPSPKGLPLVGTTLALIAAGSAPRLHIYADRRHKQLGPIFRDKIGPVSAIFLSDPDLMRSVFNQEGKCPIHVLPEAWTLYNETHGRSRGLFFMNGDEWFYHRRIMNKLLLKGDFKWIETACRAVSLETVDRWDVLRKRHGILPQLEAELYRWSLNTLVAVLLGKDDYLKYKSQLDPLLEDLASVVHLIFETSVSFQVFPASLAAKFNLPSWRRFVKAVDDALSLGDQLVTKLLNDLPEGEGLLTRMKTENLPLADISRIVVDLVLAAGDTTAYTMSWVLYLLGRDEKLQANLRSSTSPSILLKNIVRETLRLYPVAPFLTRILPQNATVGGYNIPAGTLMLFSMYTSGRNPKFFKDPDVFLPERWTRENSTTSMQQVCIPFGFGTRSCIGRKIAENQLHALLSDVVGSFNIETENEKDVEMVLKMVAVPSEPIRLKLSKL